VLAERRAGYIIILLGSLLGLVVPVIHMKGVGGEIGKSTQAFFFVWTLLALGVTAIVLRHPLGTRTVEAAMAPPTGTAAGKTFDG